MYRIIYVLSVFCGALLVFGAAISDAQETTAAADGPAALGITITVDTATDEYDVAPNGACSIREAIKTANDDANFGGCTRNGLSGPETILVPASTPITYTLTITGFEDLDVKGDLDIRGSVTLSATGAYHPDVDGNLLGDRIFQVVTGTVTFKGLDIRRSGPFGGGLLISNGKVTLEDVVVSGNQDVAGAGISNDGVLTLTHSSIISNTATAGAGGGIYNRNTLTVIQSRVISNTTTYTFPGGDGAGIYSDNGSHNAILYITNTEISANVASQLGGGIYSGGTSLSLYFSTIANNRAHGNGGGLYVYLPEFHGAEILNSTISGNRTNDSGGGVFLIGEADTLAISLDLSFVTIANNTADDDSNNFGHGGGISNGGLSDLSIGATLIAGNIDKDSVSKQPDCGGGPWISHGFNLIGNNLNCSFAGVGGDQVGTNATPINPVLGPLKNNGGSTSTHALLLGSPAINKGPTSIPCSGTDQRGIKRPQGTACDIGAYEGIFVYLPLVLKDF